MFWIDVASRSINRAYLNGSEKMTLIDSDMRTPGRCRLCYTIPLIYKLIHCNHILYTSVQLLYM